MYTSINFSTKKQLKDAVSRQDRQITVFQPNGDLFGRPVPTDGIVFIEGPRPVHKWYAEATLKNGIIVKVK